jgi:prevent-host-death family protein
MVDEPTVTVRDLRENLADHLRTVRAGRTVTVTSRGKPVAKVVPVAPVPETTRTLTTRKFGFLKGQIWMADDFDETPADVLASIKADLIPKPVRPRRRTK